MYLASAPIGWTSNIQTAVDISTVEAEYVVLSKACLTIVHLRHLMSMSVFEDNMGAVLLSETDKINPRTKHIDVKVPPRQVAREGKSGQHKLHQNGQPEG